MNYRFLRSLRGWAVGRLCGLMTGDQLHQFIDLDFSDITVNSLIVSVLTGAKAAFHIHHVAFRIVAAFFSNVVG